jgi:NAD(P)-dependent dehydrogenase (short-subunit alcohol dehydrogenase family)
MAQERVALVTGGTRGIGAAISKGLKAKGYKVAANYGGNDEAANAFKAETGIPVFKFDVGDFAACEAGIKAIEAEVGPIDVLVNNAGITRDGAFHKMTFEKWQAVIRTNLDSMFTCTRPLIVSAVWAAPSGRRCEGDIRSGMGAPSHVDVRAYGYVGADPAPGAVHRGRPAADVVGGREGGHRRRE